MKTYIIIQLIFFSILISCSNGKQEKHQTSRNNILKIKDKIIDFDTDSILIGKYPQLYLADKYLIIVDYKSLTEFIQIFDKYNFRHIASTALRGEGPTEITRIGHVFYDKSKGNLFVSDAGRQKIFCYNLDSLIKYQDYKHYVKLQLNKKEFPSQYYYINDSLTYARIIQPTGNSGFDEILAKWNMLNNKIKTLYKHSEIKRRRTRFDVSIKDSIYVECYQHHDLLTICDLDGNLKFNIYGPNWDKKMSNKIDHFKEIIIIGNNIIASYSGGANWSKDELADKLLVFNIEGDYIKTLEVGYRISDMCYDEESNRLFFSFNDMIQFGYLELTDDMLK